MSENSKTITNPLTIIAIFAGLAEVASTVALATVDKSLQITFVWFVMGFPILLVLLFFATLNFNPTVLYAPSDFRNEENFLSTLVKTRSVTLGIDQVTQQLDAAREAIIEQATAQIRSASSVENEKFVAMVDAQLKGIESRLATVRQEAVGAEEFASVSATPQSALQAKIVAVLSMAEQGLTAQQTAVMLHMSVAGTERALQRLTDRGVIARIVSKGEAQYLLPRRGIASSADA